MTNIFCQWIQIQWKRLGNNSLYSLCWEDQAILTNYEEKLIISDWSLPVDICEIIILKLFQLYKKTVIFNYNQFVGG